MALWLPTALLALAATALAALLGIPVGWALARGGRRGRGLLLGLTLAQALLPTTLTAIGWIAAFGAHGKGWTLLVWGFSFWPLAALGTWAGLARAEARLEEAALLALPPWRAALGVSLPRAAPALLASLAAAFLLMLGDLGVPGCLQVPVGAEEVHARFSATWDAGEALRLSLPILALAALLSFPLLRSRRSLGGGTGGVLRFPSAPAWIVAVASLSVPAYGMASWALQGNGLRQAAALLGREGSNTLILSGAVGILAPVLGFAVVALLRARTAWAAAPACILFAAPGTLVGILLIRLLNGTSLYGTLGMPFLAMLLRSLAPALLLAWRAWGSVPASYDEMGRVCGLSPLRRAVSISLPLCAAGLAAGGLVSAVVAAGEVAATSLVCPPGFQTLAASLFSLIHYGADAAVGAAALMVLAFVTLLGLALSRTAA